MATGTTQRHSPVGREYEPDEKPSMNHQIKYHLEVFQSVITRDVDYKDLLMLYPHFTGEQRKELSQMGKHEPRNASVVMKGLEMIHDLQNQPSKYEDLRDALKNAGYQKAAAILTGDIIPVDSNYRDHINQNFNYICQNVNPRDILADLIKHEIIDEKDLQMVTQVCNNQGTIIAMMELLFVIHQKNQFWYPVFIEALLDNNCPDVAEKIDRPLCERIQEARHRSNDTLESIYNDFTSCLPVDYLYVRKAGKQELQRQLNTDTREHIMQDFHDPSIQTNNLSPPDKPTADESLTGSVDFQEMLTDSYNVQEVDQSIPLSEGLSKISLQRASLPETFIDENPTEPLSFSSLMTDFDNQSETLTANENNTRTMSLPIQKLSSFTRDLGDGVPDLTTNNFESQSSYFQRPSVDSNDGDETSVKTVSIESNARVPDHRPTGTGSNVLQGQGHLKENNQLTLKDNSLRDNSLTPVLKVMPDKNMDVGSASLNIKTDGVSMDPSLEGVEVEDVDISLRGYQQELAEPALQGKNVIIVAPTGSGKTRVALRIIQEHIRKQQGRGIAKVIFLVNQVALANQQGEECSKQLKRYKSKVVSGETQRGRKEYLKDFLDKRDILIVTAQVLLESLFRKEIEGINMFSLMVFDECHHTHANHAFNQIMAMYISLKFSDNPPILPQIVGLTASVGVGKARNEDKAVEHIKKLMANLDAEVISTVHTNMQELRQYVSLPDEETHTVSKRQNDIFGDTVTKLMNTIEQMMSIQPVVKNMDEAKQFEKVLKSPAGKGSAQYTQWVSKLWKETAKLRSHEARRFLNPCRIHLEHYNNALIIHNDARVQDALSYLDREMKTWREQAKFMDNTEKKLDGAFKKLRAYKFDQCSDNPKLHKLCEMIVKAYKRDLDNSRGIVFVRTRELAKAIISWMKETDGLKELNPIQFLGQNVQADKGGMTKAEQDDVLKYFKDGKHKLIVATSVAEEGLDISKCNLVIRYDHVTNEIAMVQSRGRGRAKDSKYYVIAEEGTGMAEKEELNGIREIMMRKAIIKLQEEIASNPRKFRKDLHDLQDEANLDHRLKSLGSKRRLPRVGNFELQCQKCSKFICMSQDLKKIKDAHHVIVDESLPGRVDYVKNETEQCAVETNQPIGKLSCKGCGENLGVILIYRQLEFPVPKIEKFLIVDNNGRQITSKRWKDVPLVVDELRNDDFRKIIETRTQNGSLN